MKGFIVIIIYLLRWSPDKGEWEVCCSLKAKLNLPTYFLKKSSSFGRTFAVKDSVNKTI